MEIFMVRIISYRNIHNDWSIVFQIKSVGYRMGNHWKAGIHTNMIVMMDCNVIGMIINYKVIYIVTFVMINNLHGTNNGDVRT